MATATTIPAILRERALSTPTETALLHRVESGWRPLSCEELWRSVLAVAAGLEDLGIAKGDRVGILARSGLEWELMYMAALALGGVVVPLDRHDAPERWRRIAAKAGLDALLVDETALLGELPVKTAITVEEASSRATPWRTLVVGRAEPRGPLPEPRDDAMLLFTSGTTGESKGVRYTHEQVLLAARSVVSALGLEPGARLLSWLPLSSPFQRMGNLSALLAGGAVVLVEDPRRVLEALAEIPCDVVLGPPRFFEKLHAGIEAAIAKRPRPLRALIRAAVAVGDRHARCAREGRRPSLCLRALRALADRLVLPRLRRILGARAPLLISGSAPMPVRLLESFHALGFLVLEAYGLTEDIVPLSMNRPDAFRFGSVGKPLPANELRLSDDGEVLVRGPGASTGYLGDGVHGLTPDGFLATGDQGRLDEDGFLHLTGRRAELLKTSGGRRVAPAGIEAKLRAIPYVEHAAVVGADRKCLVAVMAVDPTLAQDGERIASDVRAHVSDLPRFEQPAGVLVVRDGFSVAGGELTASAKLRRSFVERKFLPAIERLYATLDRDPRLQVIYV